MGVCSFVSLYWNAPQGAAPAAGGGTMTLVGAGGTGGRADRVRVLWVTCGAHALHDGFTDALYVLLPVWQAQFALSYAAVGALRALYTAAMAGLQVPAAAATRWIGQPAMLAAGTAIAAACVEFVLVVMLAFGILTIRHDESLEAREHCYPFGS